MIGTFSERWRLMPHFSVENFALQPFYANFADKPINLSKLHRIFSIGWKYGNFRIIWQSFDCDHVELKWRNQFSKIHLNDFCLGPRIWAIVWAAFNWERSTAAKTMLKCVWVRALAMPRINARTIHTKMYEVEIIVKKKRKEKKHQTIRSLSTLVPFV